MTLIDADFYDVVHWGPFGIFWKVVPVVYCPKCGTRQAANERSKR